MIVTVAGLAFVGREPVPTPVVGVWPADAIGIDLGGGDVDPSVPAARAIPPPRWLVPRLPPATERVTARQGGLGWQTDPYAE